MDVTSLIRSGRAKSCSEGPAMMDMFRETHRQTHTHTTTWILTCMRSDKKIDTYTHTGADTHYQGHIGYNTHKTHKKVTSWPDLPFKFNIVIILLNVYVCVSVEIWGT